MNFLTIVVVDDSLWFDWSSLDLSTPRRQTVIRVYQWWEDFPLNRYPHFTEPSSVGTSLTPQITLRPGNHDFDPFKIHLGLSTSGVLELESLRWSPYSGVK